MVISTQALIIAGSILISIFSISAGIMIFNQNSGVAEEASSSMDTITNSNIFEEATTLLDPVKNFNSQFSKYIGNSVSADRAREFVNAIIKNNSNPNNHKVLLTLQEEGGITLKGHQSTTEELQYILNKIKNSKTYVIRMTSGCKDFINETYGGGYDKEGYISCMAIRPVTVWKK